MESVLISNKFRLFIIIKQSATMQNLKVPVMIGSASPDSSRWKIVSKQEVKEYPYGSILFMVMDMKSRYYGTGSFLLNQKTEKCKHIITCAHNFVFYQSYNDGTGLKEIYYDYSVQPSEWINYYGTYQTSKKPQGLSQLINSQIRLKIKKVYLHPKYLPLRKGAIIPVVFNEEQGLPKDVKNNINGQRFYDIAIVELQQEIEVPGFLILDKPIRLSQLSEKHKENIELSGFPVFQDSHGVMYKEKVGDKLDVRTFDQCIYSLKDNLGRKILRHTLSSAGGNSGSPIYFSEKDKAILLGIHTTGLGNDVKTNEPIPLKQFEFNNATDIYYSEVYDWLKNGIEGCIQESFLK